MDYLRRILVLWNRLYHWSRFRTFKAIPGPGVYGCKAADPVEHWPNHDHSICQRRRE